jgi:hypothetical protein
MANYFPGTDQGNFLSSPDYQDTFQLNIGPYSITYNGLLRPNTGIVEGDGTADSLRTAFNKVLSNLDITLTSENASITPEPLKLVVRAADGSINVGQLNATSISLSGDFSGRIYGGTW